MSNQKKFGVRLRTAARYNLRGFIYKAGVIYKVSRQMRDHLVLRCRDRRGNQTFEDVLLEDYEPVEERPMRRRAGRANIVTAGARSPHRTEPDLLDTGARRAAQQEAAEDVELGSDETDDEPEGFVPVRDSEPAPEPPLSPEDGSYELDPEDDLRSAQAPDERPEVAHVTAQGAAPEAGLMDPGENAVPRARRGPGKGSQIANARAGQVVEVP